MVGDGEVEAHHPEQRVQEPFGLAQREMGEEPQGQGGLDGEIRVAPLPTPPAAPAGRPGSDRLRCQPHRHIAAANESLIVGRPVRHAVLRLIRGMDLRLHPCSVAPAEGYEKCEPRRPTRRWSSCNNAPTGCWRCSRNVSGGSGSRCIRRRAVWGRRARPAAPSSSDTTSSPTPGPPRRPRPLGTPRCLPTGHHGCGSFGYTLDSPKPSWPSGSGRCCTNREWPARCQPTGSSPADAIRLWSADGGHPIENSQPRTTSLACPAGLRVRRPSPMMDLYRKNVVSTRP